MKEWWEFDVNEQKENATFTTTSTHGFEPGDYVVIEGLSLIPSGVYRISESAETTLTVKRSRWMTLRANIIYYGVSALRVAGVIAGGFALLIYKLSLSSGI